MSVTSHCVDAFSRLPIPDANGLIIRTWQYPRQVRVELYSTNIVCMVRHREQTASLFVVPHLNAVIISSRNKHGLRWMKGNTSNRTYWVKINRGKIDGEGRKKSQSRTNHHVHQSGQWACERDNPRAESRRYTTRREARDEWGGALIPSLAGIWWSRRYWWTRPSQNLSQRGDMQGGCDQKILRTNDSSQRSEGCHCCSMRLLSSSTQKESQQGN